MRAQRSHALPTGSYAHPCASAPHICCVLRTNAMCVHSHHSIRNIGPYQRKIVPTSLSHSHSLTVVCHLSLSHAHTHCSVSSLSHTLTAVCQTQYRTRYFKFTDCQFTQRSACLVIPPPPSLACVRLPHQPSHAHST